MGHNYPSKFWDLFGKGAEHDELRDLFIEFVEKLDQRLVDSETKRAMMIHLRTAAEEAHRAIAEGYPTIKDLNPLPKRVPGFVFDKETMVELPQPEEILTTDEAPNKVSEFDAKDINYKDFRTAEPFPPEVTVTKASAYEAPETRIEIQKD